MKKNRNGLIGLYEVEQSGRFLNFSIVIVENFLGIGKYDSLCYLQYLRAFR